MCAVKKALRVFFQNIYFCIMPAESSWNYFFDNKEKWLKEHPGGFVIIKDGKFCALYTDERAVEGNARKYGDDLLIMHLDPAGVKEYHLFKKT